MTILTGVPWLQVRVIVDGKALKEYDDPKSAKAPTETSKYIEARSKKNFKIRADFSRKFTTVYDVATKLCVDGVEVDETHVQKLALQPNYRHEVKGALSCIGGVTEVSFFRFAEQATFEGIDTSKEMTTDLDKPTKSPVGWAKWDLVDENAFATFTFKYRSLQSPKSLQIIPRSPSPVPERALESSEKTPPHPAAFSSGHTRSSSQSALTFRSSHRKWQALSDDDIKALLNHYTGRNIMWEGLDRTDLETLLEHHKNARRNGHNAAAHIKRECAEDADDDDLVVTDERNKKRKSLPGKDHDVIELD
ncbi:hypothetical protein P171DRAFT_488338 [Karstenula rhodostoma CBS 690.94]|uniref:DUF7918 domain-containing protein n=1 Tax=Karstenula rhodostoma CBS 690.94 TaxID=1392251 RepID=A0A9P4PEW7_9PLEO|nr:hypothetical protein P171DRAFT_488338 [Karstenula rhodostoma CBS 690.94]